MSKANLLIDAISVALKPAGFQRKSSTWHSSSDEITQVVNLQRSDYSVSYYLNIALWIKELGENQSPKQNECPVRFRWDKLIARDHRELQALLDLNDESVSSEDRARPVTALIRDYVLPFFSATKTLEGVRTVYHAHPWLPNCTYAVAKPLRSGD